MDLTERFYLIDRMLRERKLVTRAQFLKTLDVSLATFKRDLEYLRDRLHAQKRELASGRYGYAISPPGKRDRGGGADYVDDIETVIKRVVFDGYGVRSKSNRRSGNTLRLGGTVVTGYKIAASLRHLVHGAEVEPIGELPA